MDPASFGGKLVKTSLFASSNSSTLNQQSIVKREPSYFSANQPLRTVKSEPLGLSQPPQPGQVKQEGFNPFANHSRPNLSLSSSSNSSVDHKPSVIFISDEPIGDFSCPECGPSALIVESAHEGINVCQECGLQLGGNVISDESEWRNFGADDSNKGGEDQSRVGGPESEFNPFGLSTMLGKDADGNLSSLSRIQNAIAQQNAAGAPISAINSKSLMDGFRKAQKLCSTLGLPSIITEKANELYKKLMESGQFPNRKQDVAIGTCIFIACKLDSQHSRTMKEICAAADLKLKDVGRCFTNIKKLRIVKRNNSNNNTTSSNKPNATANGTANNSSIVTSGVGIGTSILGENSSTTSANDAVNLVERFCNILRLPMEIVRHCIHVVTSAGQLNIGDGKLPATIAGAAIYLVTSSAVGQGIERTLNQIAAVTHMAPGTIKTTYLILLKDKSSLLPNNFQSKLE